MWKQKAVRLLMSAMKQKGLKKVYHVRWMIRRDMPEVLKIENASFDSPWTEEEFTKALRQRTCIGMVAEIDDEMVGGYMLYELHKNRLHLINFAVSPQFRRQGVGRAMAEKLYGKLHAVRNRITLDIRETNLEGQLFFKACGYKATKVIRGFHGNEDAYAMERRFQASHPEIDCLYFEG